MSAGIVVKVLCGPCHDHGLRSSCICCGGTGWFEFVDETATEADRCTCPYSVRLTGQHSVACPLGPLSLEEAA